MRGVDVSPWTPPLDSLFEGGDWAKLAVGDGGNEVGMGKLPAGLIAQHVPNGAEIACVTSCDHLVVAGVSNWGAYGLMAALAVLRPDWAPTIAKFLTAERDFFVTDATVKEAGAVDGVTALAGSHRGRIRAGNSRPAGRSARSHCVGRRRALACAPWKIPTLRRIPRSATRVRQLCLKFDGAYWRELDRERGYPTAFVKALTEAGWLSILIPEEYGGAGLGISAASAVLEEIHKAGCNAAACHAQMYIMGTVLRHGSKEQKERYLPKIATGELRLQAFGVTEPSAAAPTRSACAPRR